MTRYTSRIIQIAKSLNNSIQNCNIVKITVIIYLLNSLVGKLPAQKNHPICNPTRSLMGEIKDLYAPASDELNRNRKKKKHNEETKS